MHSATLPGRAANQQRHLGNWDGENRSCDAANSSQLSAAQRRGRLSRGRSPTQGRSFRIGYLSFIPGEDSTVILERLNEVGYRQGESLDVAHRSADAPFTNKVTR